MLTRYREVASNGTLRPPRLPGVAVRPGDACDDLPMLARLLAALGDLPGDRPRFLTPARYEGAMVGAVKHFQLRHGLDADGVIGGRTANALAVPLSWRVRQIELSLERLRWLPHLTGRRLVAINVPMFRLWAWDANPAAGVPTLGMDVIVGRALDTETPVFAEEMRAVIFRPVWNVPVSIARKEIVPAARRDPGYLTRENLDIVAGPADDAPVVPPTPDNLARLAAGALTVRQRPGPKNSLGLVKFVFPNDEGVYVHGTPAQALFGRSRRDFSHGCVRVADPVALAAWVLGEQPEWTRETIIEAMNGTRSRRVTLARPLQVLLFYMTAVVSPDDGTMRFADDIYRHDRTLDRALGSAPYQ